MDNLPKFIPRPYRKKVVTVRIESDKLACIDRLLAVYGLNRSELINRCIDYGLEHMPEDRLAQEEGRHPGQE